MSTTSTFNKPPQPSSDKSFIRENVWTQLRLVAIPDSRFHHDYSAFIADFIDSSKANDLLTSLPIYKSSSTVFIAPDNCLRELRFRALQDGKTVLMTTYGILRGFWLLDPATIPNSRWEVASFLDGMELYGRKVSLAEIKGLYQESKIPLMVTGTGAISSTNGLRFGKGHGFFDLEWGMLFELAIIDQQTTTMAVLHQCQVVDDDLVGEEWDTGCDYVVTNKRVFEVNGARKPECGILWEMLQMGMEEDIEPLRELRGLLEGEGKVIMGER